MKAMKKKLTDRIEKWLESLDEVEKTQVEVLDAYFTFRSPLPVEEPGFGKAVPDYKTTDDIIDDLQNMMPVSQSVVIGYMQSHEYGFTTVGDGSVRWAVWRYPDMTVLD